MGVPPPADLVTASGLIPVQTALPSAGRPECTAPRHAALWRPK